MKTIRNNDGAIIVPEADYISEKAIKRFNARAKLAGVLRVVFSLLILVAIIGGTVVDAEARRDNRRIAAETEL